MIKRRINRLKLIPPGVTLAEKKTIQRLREIEAGAKPKPWRASSALVSLNLDHLAGRTKEVIQEEARRRGISYEHAAKEAIEIVRRIEHAIGEESKTVPPTITAVGVGSVSMMGDMLNYYLKQGKMPKKFSELTEKEKEEMGLGKGIFAEVVDNWAAAGYPKYKSTIHGDWIANIIDSVFKRKELDPRAVRIVVHEFLETSGRMPQGRHEGTQFYTKEEAELSDYVMKNFRTIFKKEYTNIDQQKKSEIKNIQRTLSQGYISPVKGGVAEHSFNEGKKLIQGLNTRKIKALERIFTVKDNVRLVKENLSKREAEDLQAHVNIATGGALRYLTPRFQDNLDVVEAAQRAVLQRMLKEAKK